MRNWKGTLVLLFFILWPFIWFFSSLIIFGFEAQCAVDVCGPSPTALETTLYFLYMISPPILVITAWVNWRLKLQKRIGLSDAT
ncbi:hypothetical protein [Paraglaciecola sp.]|uniref:hypothetical protein n=1 Tax=Paraglaciecola sp. TaxID=1920173 RepID=UPI0032649CD6